MAASPRETVSFKMKRNRSSGGGDCWRLFSATIPQTLGSILFQIQCRPYVFSTVFLMIVLSIPLVYNPSCPQWENTPSHCQSRLNFAGNRY